MTPVIAFTPHGPVVVHTDSELLVLCRIYGGFLQVRALHRLERTGG